MPTAMPLEDLLEHLHSPDGRTRERAIRRLLRRGRTGFTPEQGVLVLKASSLPYPPRRDRADDTAVDLVRAARTFPTPNICRTSSNGITAGRREPVPRHCGC